MSLSAILLAAVCATVSSEAQAQAQSQSQSQSYPNRPIKVVVPFPAGGPTDGMARIVSERLGAVLGQSIIIENRGGGAGGSVGAKFVAAAEPDGYTILLTPGGSLTNGPAVHKNIGYDPVKAFTPVALLMTAPLIMTVIPQLPVNSVKELVEYTKANPGKVSWGSPGFGTGPHLLCEMFNFEAGARFQHVPYRGTAPAITALLAGEVQTITDPSTTILPHIQGGKGRPLAVTTATRSKSLPDVPTMSEAGYPNMQRYFWLGVVAPGGTPPEIVNKLNDAFRQTLAAPDTAARLAHLGADVAIGTPEEFRKMLADELALWTRIAKAANIQVD
jgi:tripartite-type tricarboxylate transporter receptor subunit TctC